MTWLISIRCVEVVLPEEQFKQEKAEKYKPNRIRISNRTAKLVMDAAN
jgi:hypothetical protein